MSAEPQIKIYQDDITPFLQRLPAFLLFPFKPAPLIMIAGLSALSIVTVFALCICRHGNGVHGQAGTQMG